MLQQSLSAVESRTRIELSTFSLLFLRIFPKGKRKGRKCFSTVLVYEFHGLVNRPVLMQRYRECFSACLSECLLN